jgi:hypothetical protein
MCCVIHFAKSSCFSQANGGAESCNAIIPVSVNFSEIPSSRAACYAFCVSVIVSCIGGRPVSDPNFQPQKVGGASS